MTNIAATTFQIASTSLDVAQTFVEQHTSTIGQLRTFVGAVKNYVSGQAGSNAALQEAMRPLRVPSSVNMKNALQWAMNAVQAEEKALALEMQKEAALTTLKAAERNRRDAERLAQRARKAWAALTVNPIVIAPGASRKMHASNANHHNAAA